MLTYQQAEALFATAKDKERGKPLLGNTRLYKRPGYYGIVLYKTEIVKIFPDNIFELDSGGYHTKTTKERINTYAPITLYADKGLWLFNGYVFEDGVKIDKHGKPTVRPVEVKSVFAKKHALDRAVKTYINGFAKDVKENGLKKPSGGDCWLCGFLPENTPHLISHMIEDYFVPTLLAKAVQESITGTSWQGKRPEEAAEKAFNTTWYMMSDPRYGSDMVKRALRSYFKRRKALLLKGFNPEDFAKQRKEHLNESES